MAAPVNINVTIFFLEKCLFQTHSVVKSASYKNKGKQQREPVAAYKQACSCSNQEKTCMKRVSGKSVWAAAVQRLVFRRNNCSCEIRLCKTVSPVTQQQAAADKKQADIFA